MKPALFASLGLLLAASAECAFAADMPLAPPLPSAPPAGLRWSGFYAGLNAGAAFGSFDPKTTTSPGTYLTDPADIAAINAAGAQSIKPTGFTGGAQAGYNWQWGSWVAGIEADYDFMHLRGAANSGAVAYPHGPGFGYVVGGVFYPINQFVIGSYADADWLATVRSRIGLVQDNWMFYATGGVALTQANDSFVFTDGAAGVSTLALEAARINNALKVGYVVGGGVEAGITDRLSVRAEYLHVGFGATTAAPATNNLPTVLAGFPSRASQSFAQSASLSADIVRVGLDYKLLDPGTAGAASGLGGVGRPPPWPALPVSAASDWEFDAGSRTWWSFGSDAAPQPLYNHPQILASRITFGDLDALSGEVYGRVDHASGAFVKGLMGAGRIYHGQMNDEDFPGAVSYSNTLSSGSGSIGYATVDAGYSFLRAPGARLGAFIGYAYYTQHIDTYGCTQLAGDLTCAPGSFPPGFPGLAEDEDFNAMRVGLSSELRLGERVKFIADAAYLPWMSFRGQDDHNARQLLLPMRAVDGDGVMLEGVLSYDITPHWNVGVGARYWAFNTRLGSATFDFLGVGGPLRVEPMGAATERYGVFVQSGYHFGDTTPRGPAGGMVAVARPMDWTGFYVGGHLGGGFSDAAWSDPFGSAPSGLGGVNVEGFGDKTHATGPLGGGQVGVRWQGGAWVVGADADASAAHLHDQNTCFSGLGGINCEHEVKAVVSAAARLGFAFDRSLLYAKAGGAWADTAYALNGNTFNVALGTGSSTVTALGWLAGVGLEYALTDHWTTAVEYDHIDLGNLNVPFPSVAVVNSQAVAVSQTIDRIMLGVNYKFGWATPVVVAKD